MACTPDSVAAACRGIQYTFAYYTIGLAILGGITQRVANNLDVQSRAGTMEDAPIVGELSFLEIRRRNARLVDRRLYAMRSAAWFTLSLALVVAAVLSSLVINFPWFYWWGVAAIVVAVVIVAFPFLRYYASDSPRLQWLRTIFMDELLARIIFEREAFGLIAEILRLSPWRFRQLKREMQEKREQVETKTQQSQTAGEASVQQPAPPTAADVDGE